jgi:hypothetical protein
MKFKDIKGDYMKVYECSKCNSSDVFMKQSGNQIGLYCGDCGKWIKWLNKEEQRLAERQINSNVLCKDTEDIISSIAKQAYDEISKSTSKNKYELFVKEFNKLVRSESKKNINDVGCAISDECSLDGCWRYSVCDLKRKNVIEVD